MPKIADFSTDTQNANRGTERGHYALDESLRRYGAGRVDDWCPGPGIRFIYVLLDPENYDVRYVGASNNPNRRLKQLCWRVAESRVTNTSRWIAGLRQRGTRPLMAVLEVTSEQWGERERFWIQYFLDRGAPLTNVFAGGNGGSIFVSEKTRRKIAKNACHPQSKETRRRISDSKRGMRFSQEHRDNLSKRKREFFANVANTFALSRHWAVLNDEQVREVWRLARDGAMSQKEIADRYGIPASTVSEIKHGKRYKHALVGLCEDVAMRFTDE